MKKVVVCVTVLMFLLMMPFVLFAKTSISESEMSAITAQEGVTINFGAGLASSTMTVTNFAPSIVSWGDANGFTGSTGAGYVGVRGVTINAASTINMWGNMTIDVGTNVAGVTKVQIGLPVILVHPLVTDATVALGTTKDLAGTQVMGTFYNDQFALIVNSLGTGSMTIGAHAASQGVEIGFNNFYLAIPGTPIIVSWGDSGGFGATYTSAGYVGVKGFTAANGGYPPNVMTIALSGTQQIDVGTSGGVTAINVGLPTTTIVNANITAPLALGAQKDFSDNQPLLGTLYAGGLNATTTGSFIITSH